jgi:hypothetical protein
MPSEWAENNGTYVKFESVFAATIFPQFREHLANQSAFLVLHICVKAKRYTMLGIGSFCDD